MPKPSTTNPTDHDDNYGAGKARAHTDHTKPAEYSVHHPRTGEHPRQTKQDVPKNG